MHIHKTCISLNQLRSYTQIDSSDIFDSTKKCYCLRKILWFQDNQNANLLKMDFANRKPTSRHTDWYQWISSREESGGINVQNRHFNNALAGRLFVHLVTLHYIVTLFFLIMCYLHNMYIIDAIKMCKSEARTVNNPFTWNGNSNSFSPLCVDWNSN